MPSSNHFQRYFYFMGKNTLATSDMRLIESVEKEIFIRFFWLDDPVRRIQNWTDEPVHLYLGVSDPEEFAAVRELLKVAQEKQNFSLTIVLSGAVAIDYEASGKSFEVSKNIIVLSERRPLSGNLEKYLDFIHKVTPKMPRVQTFPVGLIDVHGKTKVSDAQWREDFPLEGVKAVLIQSGNGVAKDHHGQVVASTNTLYPVGKKVPFETFPGLKQALKNPGLSSYQLGPLPPLVYWVEEASDHNWICVLSSTERADPKGLLKLQKQVEDNLAKVQKWMEIKSSHRPEEAAETQTNSIRLQRFQKPFKKI